MGPNCGEDNDYYNSEGIDTMTNVPLLEVWKCETNCFYGADCDGFVWKNNACLFYKNTKCDYKKSEENSYCFTKPSQSNFFFCRNF